MSEACIYRIVHLATGRCYVGHTTTTGWRRWTEHRNKLRRGKHHSPRMQNAWDKYGEGAFRFEEIEQCSLDQKLIREQHFIDTLDSAFNAYRKAATPGKMPEDRIENLRERMTGNIYCVGRVHPPDERERRAAAARGKKRTDEQRANMSAAMTGVPHPNAPKTRPPHTDAAKVKIKAARAKQVLKPRSAESKARAGEKMRAHLAMLKAEGKPWGRQRSKAT